MTSLRVRVNVDDVTIPLKRLSDKLAKRAIYRSLNKAINGARVGASRAVRAELTLKAKDVKRDLTVRRARPKGLEAALIVKITPTGLIKFRARDTTRGVTVQVKRRATRKRLPHAFIATMKSGHRGVWTREKGAGRTPIGELFSTAPGQFLAEESVLEPIGAEATKRLNRELSAQVDHLLR